MNLVSVSPAGFGNLPVAIDCGGEHARTRFVEFFTAQICYAHTRRSYVKAATEFLCWCELRDLTTLAAIAPIHVAAWIEGLTKTRSAPTVKQRLAAVQQLFDWLVTDRVMVSNPAHSVRSPAHSRRRGETPVLSPQEARQLLDSLPADTIVGKRDRALITTPRTARPNFTIGAATT